MRKDKVILKRINKKKIKEEKKRFARIKRARDKRLVGGASWIEKHKGETSR